MTVALPPDVGRLPERVERLVADLGRIGYATSPSFSPDGERLCFVSDLAGSPQVFVVPSTGGSPRRITALAETVVASMWSPRGDHIAVMAAPGGGLNAQVFVCAPDGSGLRRLTDGGDENNWLTGWTHDGDAVHLSSSRRDRAAMDCWLIDVATGEFRLVARNRGTGRISDVSRDGSRVLLHRVVNRSDSDVVLVDRGTERIVWPHDDLSLIGLARFAPDGETVYLGSDVGRERMAAFRIRLGADASPDLIAERKDGELAELRLTEDGSVAALAWNVGGAAELDLLDLRTGRAERVEPPAEIAAALDLSRDGRRLAFVANGSRTQSDVWVYDRTTKALAQVTRSLHEGVDLASLIAPTLERYRAHDGLEITGWLYLPPSSARPGPMVLSFHGGPEAQERPLLSRQYQALLACGIAVFAPNVRGSSGFGKTFMNLDNGRLRVDAVRDIGATVEHVVSRGLADRRRIGIMGGSYGGFMTMAGITEFPDAFAAATIVCGVVNFETFFKHTQPWMAAISKVEYGDPETELDLLRSLSPIHKVGRVRAPTLVLHGANDTNVPVVEAEQVVDSLRSRGVPVGYVLFPDEGHGFIKPENRVRATLETTRWFARYLTASAAAR